MAAENKPPAVDSAALQAELLRLQEALALAERDWQLLGYEIHDGIVQDLTAAAMHLESAGQKATFSSREAEDNYAGGLRLLRDSIAAARGLVRGLSAAPVDQDGLVAALAQLSEKFRTELALPTTFS